MLRPRHGQHTYRSASSGCASSAHARASAAVQTHALHRACGDSITPALFETLPRVAIGRQQQTDRVLEEPRPLGALWRKSVKWSESGRRAVSWCVVALSSGAAHPCAVCEVESCAHRLACDACTRGHYCRALGHDDRAHWSSVGDDAAVSVRETCSLRHIVSHFQRAAASELMS